MNGKKARKLRKELKALGDESPRYGFIPTKKNQEKRHSYNPIIRLDKKRRVYQILKKQV